MALKNFEIVGMDGVGYSHVEYKGVHYELDPDTLTDEQAELLLGKTPHIVRKQVPAEAAASAEPTGAESAAEPTAAATQDAEPAPRPKGKSTSKTTAS